MGEQGAPGEGFQDVPRLAKEAGLWPTATSTDAKSSARHGYMIEGNAGTTLLDAVRGWTPESPHWPTPDAFVSNDGEEPESFLARKSFHAAKPDATRAGVPLAVAVKWATPTARDGMGGPGTSPKRNGGENLRTQAVAAAAWDTPRATEGEKGGPNDRDGSGSPHLASQASLWPTTTTTQDAKNNGGPSQQARNTPPLNAVAVSRPGLVLNPVFVEALMGWPLGWTDPLRPAGAAVPFPPPPKGPWAAYLKSFPGTEPALPKSETLEHRTDRLRACGNGVVPQQAAAAIGELLDALGGAYEEQVQVVQGEARGPNGLRRLQEATARSEGAHLGGDEPRHTLPRRELRALLEVQPTPAFCAGGDKDVRGLRQDRLRLHGADPNTQNTATVTRGWRNRWRR